MLNASIVVWKINDISSIENLYFSFDSVIGCESVVLLCCFRVNEISKMYRLYSNNSDALLITPFTLCIGVVDGTRMNLLGFD